MLWIVIIKNQEYDLGSRCKYFLGILISFGLRNIYILNPVLVFFVKNILNDPVNFIKSNYVIDKSSQSLFKYFNDSSILK